MKRELKALRIYDVSHCGKIVWKIKTGKKLSFSVLGGYNRIHLTVNGERGNYGVSRLVATKFVHNPDPVIYTDVNHISGDKADDSKGNVEWCTKSENQYHAYKKGLNWNHKKDSRNKEMLYLINSGASQRFVARKFGISQCRVSQIIRGTNN